MSPQVLVGNDTTSHDLDGVGIAGFEDGSHLIQLQLGMAFDPRALVMTDRDVGVWKFISAPSIMLSRDEYEVWNMENIVFSMPFVELKVPENAPRLELLSPVAEKEIRLEKIQVSAKTDPFTWGAAVIFADGRRLTCGPAGWFLGTDKARFRIDLEVRVEG